MNLQFAVIMFLFLSTRQLLCLLKKLQEQHLLDVNDYRNFLQCSCLELHGGVHWLWNEDEEQHVPDPAEPRIALILKYLVENKETRDSAKKFLSKVVKRTSTFPRREDAATSALQTLIRNVHIDPKTVSQLVYLSHHI